MDAYPYTFKPIYVEKIWGGRNLARLFSRPLPAGKQIGESWELADLPEGVSVAANGPAAGTSLTGLTRELGDKLLGSARPMPDGRFPLLLKLLDANDILSLQVHPDAEAVAAIGGAAALKTECWYVVESRDGMIYKGLKPDATPEAFRAAVKGDRAEQVVRALPVADGDFHYLPAGTVHALGAGVVVAEVQTPSDTTYRVTDWGRGREIHVERSMECIHFEPADDTVPGAGGETLLVTEFFTVGRRTATADAPVMLPAGRCAAVMILSVEGTAEIRHAGGVEPVTPIAAGETILLPASLKGPALTTTGACGWLETTLPETG